MRLKPQTLTVVPGAEGGPGNSRLLGTPTPQPPSLPWCPGCSVSFCPAGDVETRHAPPTRAAVSPGRDRGEEKCWGLDGRGHSPGKTPEGLLD